MENYSFTLTVIKMIEYSILVAMIYKIYLIYSNGNFYLKDSPFAAFIFHVVWIPIMFCFYKKLVPTIHSPLILIYEWYEGRKILKHLNKKLNIVNAKLEWTYVRTSERSVVSTKFLSLNKEQKSHFLYLAPTEKIHRLHLYEHRASLRVLRALVKDATKEETKEAFHYLQAEIYEYCSPAEIVLANIKNQEEK